MNKNQSKEDVGFNLSAHVLRRIYWVEWLSIAALSSASVWLLVKIWAV